MPIDFINGLEERNKMEKKFNSILILNWKTGAVRILKKKTKPLPYEVPITLDITLVIPENPPIVAKGEIEVPTYKVKEMIVDRLSQ